MQRRAASRYRPRVAKGNQAGGDPAPGLARLPPGRHGLSREFVAKNQRDRLTAGMIATVAEHGFHEATITQIAAAAGVSRRTFYSYFSSKEECFFDTFGQVADHLEGAMTAAGPRPTGPGGSESSLAPCSRPSRPTPTWPASR